MSWKFGRGGGLAKGIVKMYACCVRPCARGAGAGSDPAGTDPAEDQVSAVRDYEAQLCRMVVEDSAVHDVESARPRDAGQASSACRMHRR